MKISISTLVLCCTLWVSPLAAKEVSIEHNELQLLANLEVTDGSQLSDGVILMLHGTLAHFEMEIISTLQALFLENGRNSLAINLSLDMDGRRGFYPCDRPHTHISDDSAEELDAWMKWLSEQGTGQVVILGHSLGGLQVARFLASNDPEAQAFVLIAPALGQRRPNDAAVEIADDADGSEWLEDASFLQCANARVSVESYRSYYRAEDSLRLSEALELAKLPGIVFAGSDDEIVSGLTETMSAIDKDELEYVVIDGAGHFFLDLYSYDLVDAAVEFLDALD